MVDDNGMDKVSLELEKIRSIFNHLKQLDPAARVRVFRYVQELLGEEP